MTTKHKKDDVFVTIFVMLTGIGFGALTGSVYSASYWWVGAITGFVSSYLLAKLYLKLLRKMSSKGYSGTGIWLSGTLAATICGIICTVLIHGMMILITYNSNVSQTEEGFGGIILAVGIIIGAVAGLVVGGICSLIYVLLLEDM